jgi:membrane protein DedA with SNARE-associated domain
MSSIAAIASLFVAAALQPDITCVTTGVLIAMEKISPAVGIGICLSAILLGDVAMVYLGRFLGQAFLDNKLRPWLLDRQSMQQWKEWIVGHAPQAAFLSRFLPGMSMIIHWTLGIVCLQPRKLILPLVLANVVYTSIVIGTSWAAAESSRRMADATSIPSAWVMVSAAAVVWVIYRLIARILAKSWQSMSNIRRHSEDVSR